MKRVWMALAILTLSATSALAQPGINGIGFSVGVVDVDNVDSSSLGFGLFADLGLPTMPFSIEPYVDYWSNSESIPTGGDVTARDIAVGAKGLFNISLPNPVVKPFLGAGLGMHFMKVETPAIDMGGGVAFPAFEATDSKLGIDLGGGVGFGVGSVELRGEGWYTIISDANTMGARASLVIPFGM